MNVEARPIGGPIATWPFRVLLGIFVAGVVVIGWRYLAGLGPTTGMNDGFPWGIWIAYDVVVGTALACGGYAVAILCYVLNRGEYHPLVRPAILTSALGYSMAAVSVFVDVGRYWALPKVVMFPWNWNLSSVLLEVALCVMAYMAVLWIELFPAQLEQWERGSNTRLRELAQRISPFMNRALIWIIGLGLVLPTMHQSSLGSVMLMAGNKLDALWLSPFLPMLFLISCVGMGYAIVVFESTICATEFRRPKETHMLASLSVAMIAVLGLFLALRFWDLSMRDQFGRLFSNGWLSVFFWIEVGLFAAPAVMLIPARIRRDEGKLLLAAMLMLLGGALYRFNAYLIAFNPGPGWSYFPSVPEMLVTFGIVAAEIMAYIVIVKRYPILRGEHPREHRVREDAAAVRGVLS